MEKVITNELTKFLFVIGAAVVALTALMANRIAKVKGSFAPYRKATLLYMLLSLLFFGLVSIFAYPGILSSPINCFIVFQIYFLLLGISHFYFMHQYLAWGGSGKTFWLELIFTILIGLLGSIALVIVYPFFSKNRMEYFMTGSILLFIVPLVFYHTFRKAIDIPPKIMKQWFYPVNQEIEEPEDSKLKNLLVISFEFQKNIYDQNVTNFRAKAPVDMDFGQLFYYFINDYNERHEESKIQYVNDKREPHGWIFYKKPNWHSIQTKYIDAEKTIYSNRIKENDVIICTRSQT